MLLSEAAGALNGGGRSDACGVECPYEGGSSWCTIFSVVLGSGGQSGCWLQSSHQPRNRRITLALYM